MKAPIEILDEVVQEKLYADSFDDTIKDLWRNEDIGWGLKNIKEVVFEAMHLYAESQKPKWISVKDELPKFHDKVLIRYLKNKVPVITEGYYCDHAQDTADSCRVYNGETVNGTHTKEFWTRAGYGYIWFDYSDRQIQNSLAKKSKNEVTHWQPLPEATLAT